MNTENLTTLEAQISATIQTHREAAFRSIEDHMCTAYEEVAALIRANGIQDLPDRSINGISTKTLKSIYRQSTEGKGRMPEEDEVIRIKILEFIKARSLAFEAQRIKYPNYLKPWKKEDDEKLEMLWCEGVTLSNLSKIFLRNKGAIVARIEKLELEQKYGDRK